MSFARSGISIRRDRLPRPGRTRVAHPSVAEAAVIGIADPKWGEVPVAVVTRRPSAEVSTEELIAFTRTQLAGFKTPKHVYFRELPKSGTGKILKHRLRELISPEAPQARSATGRVCGRAN
ncbi:hypothetical protein ACH47B_20380 [Rhodococcus sp. NPDC019627]|uniref:AMP-binding enzyme n=1 Tax=unclassified Rhodococcus (in: high G+C Gram-positive bacteria) TaxID=192944 RepID=UPI0033BFBB16